MGGVGFGCEFGDCMTQPNHLITTISNGACVSLCDEHYPAGLIPLLAAELGVDPGNFYQMIERYLTAQAKKAGKELAEAQAAEAAEGSQDLATPPDGAQDDNNRPDDASMADIIPEDWAGEAMT